MKHLGIIVLFLFFSTVCKCQTQSGDSLHYTQAIKAQAETMRQLLLKKDYKAFIKFTYPTMVELMGGAEKMADVMQKGSKRMEAEGTTFQNITIGEPSKIIVTQDELQCTLPQTIELKVPEGRIVTKSTLIAISTDNGKNWFFVDTSDKDLAAMQNALPSLSSDLVIPEKQEPLFYPNPN